MANRQVARVGIVMGSRSDWPTLEHAAQTLAALGIPFETRVVSAHRTPDLLFAYAESAAERGLRAIIAGAGGAAHLPGMLAAKTWLPVHGVPVESKALSGLDSLFSIVQMPAGIPVGTFAIGRAGAINAALQAAAWLATTDPALRERLEAWRARQTADVLAHPDPAKAPVVTASASAPGSVGAPRARRVRRASGRSTTSGAAKRGRAPGRTRRRR